MRELLTADLPHHHRNRKVTDSDCVQFMIDALQYSGKWGWEIKLEWFEMGDKRSKRGWSRQRIYHRFCSMSFPLCCGSQTGIILMTTMKRDMNCKLFHMASYCLQFTILCLTPFIFFMDLVYFLSNLCVDSNEQKKIILHIKWEKQQEIQTGWRKMWKNCQELAIFNIQIWRKYIWVSERQIDPHVLQSQWL